jgi:hypothetical protein
VLGGGLTGLTRLVLGVRGPAHALGPEARRKMRELLDEWDELKKMRPLHWKGELCIGYKGDDPSTPARVGDVSILSD